MEKEKADAVITAYLEKIYGFAVKKCFSYAEAEGPFRAQGVLFDLDETSGKTLSVKRIEFGE